MNTLKGSLDSVECPEYLAAASTRGFRPAVELDDDELSKVIESLADRLLSAPTANGWITLLGIAAGRPEFGGETCCQRAPGGLMLASDLALLQVLMAGDRSISLEIAQSAPRWRRHADDRRVYIFRTAPQDPRPTGRLHRSPVA